MPFVEVDIDKEIERMRDSDAEFKQSWDDSRMEYGLLGDLIRLRKEKGISQKELAEIVGNKQQVISRIEKREQNPTLKTLCRLADVLNADIRIVPR